MPDITMPDGTIVQGVPDTPEAKAQLSAAWQRKSAGTSAPVPAAAADSAAPSVGGVRGELVRDALGRGLASTPAAFADILGMMTNDREDGELFPHSAAVSSLGTKPQNPQEQYANAALEGGGGALLPPGGGGLMRQLATKLLPGMLSGVGGEVGAQLFPEQGVAARLGGGLAGGLTAGTVGALRSTKEDLARATVKGVAPEELAAARLRMENAQAAGTPVTAAQAMDRRGTAIDAMQGSLANKSSGQRTQDILTNQPTIATNTTAATIENLPGAVAAKPYSPTLRAALDAGTVPGSVNSEILRLQKSLASRKNGNEAYANTVKTWLSEKVAAARQTDGVGDNPNFATVMNASLGSPGTARNQGVLDALQGLAVSQKLPPETYAKGLVSLREYLMMAANRPGSVGNITSDLSTASHGQAQEAVRTNLSTITFGLRQKIANLRGAGAERFVDQLLTTPEGMATLEQFARNPVMSRGAQTALSTVLGAVASDKADE